MEKDNLRKLSDFLAQNEPKVIIRELAQLEYLISGATLEVPYSSPRWDAPMDFLRGIIETEANFNSLALPEKQISKLKAVAWKMAEEFEIRPIRQYLRILKSLKFALSE